MKSSSLYYNWLVLFVLNNMAIILGLYLPVNFPCVKINVRKISIVVFFVNIFSILISLIFIEQQSNDSDVGVKQIYLIFYTICINTIILNRYRYYVCFKNFFKTLLNISEFDVKECVLKKRVMKNVLYHNIKLLLMTFLFNMAVLYSAYTKNISHYHIIHEMMLFIVLSFESCFTIQGLEIMENITLKLTKDLKSLYKNFHEVPTAELKKCDNGDLILIGWISEAIDFNRKREALDDIEKLSRVHYAINNCIKRFNLGFGSSIVVVVLVSLAKGAVIFCNCYDDTYTNINLLLADSFELVFILVSFLRNIIQT